MPIFSTSDDPGSSFPELLRRVGLGGEPLVGASTDLMRELVLPHATTCVALTYADGVVMAGDRRATAGNLISHRSMEKVVQADRYSGVAIAGAAGPVSGTQLPARRPSSEVITTLAPESLIRSAIAKKNCVTLLKLHYMPANLVGQ